MNVWSFIGRVGKDAELSYVGQGNALLSFSVAVDSGYGDKKATTWTRVQVWGKRGEGLNGKILKGDRIGIVGEVTLREYEGKNGKAFSLDVRASDVTLMGGAKDQAAAEKPSAKPAAHDDYNDSEIPF